MTYAEYLAAEERAAERHESLAGMVWAISGGTPEHARLSTALELFRRGADQRWEFLEFEGSAVLELQSIAVTVPLAELYDNPLA